MWPLKKLPAGAGAGVSVPTIDVKQAYARSTRGAKLVDLRSAREFTHDGHPAGAVSVTPQLIKNDQTGLARDDEILVICMSGHRSLRQARKLAELGFTRVTNVGGGLTAWKSAGLPVDR